MPTSSKKKKQQRQARAAPRGRGGRRSASGIVGHLDNMSMLRSILNSMQAVNNMPKKLEQNLQDGFRKLEMERVQKKEAKRKAKEMGVAPMQDVQRGFVMPQAPEVEMTAPESLREASQVQPQVQQQPLGGQTDAMRRANLATDTGPIPVTPVPTASFSEGVPADLGDSTRSQVRVVHRAPQRITMKLGVPIMPKKKEMATQGTQTALVGPNKRTRRALAAAAPYERPKKFLRDDDNAQYTETPLASNSFDDYIMNARTEFQAETSRLRRGTTARASRYKARRGDNPFLEYIRSSRT
jgi:hypothetical protein